MRVAIRDARPGDAADIADAHVAAWRTVYRGIIADAILDSADFHRARLEGWTQATEGRRRPHDDPLQRLIVPEVDDRIVGFAIFGRERDPDEWTPATERGELYGFYLHPDVWGSGVARALMGETLDGLASRFATAVLWVLSDNPRARRFYERSGWSCGEGDDIVTGTWAGPVIPGSPELDPPLREVQYWITW